MPCPFPPCEQIPQMFMISADANTVPLQDLVSYVRTNWIENTTWPASTWCIFLLPIRMNNDLEGWHRCLNSHASKDYLNVYLLITLLHSEAKLVQLQVSLLSVSKLKRNQKKSQRDMKGKIFNVWDAFTSREKNPKDLLKTVSRVYAPPDIDHA